MVAVAVAVAVDDWRVERFTIYKFDFFDFYYDSKFGWGQCAFKIIDDLNTKK